MSDLEKYLLQFVREQSLSEELVEAGLQAARYLLKDEEASGERGDQAQDLCMDFLLNHVLPNGVTGLRTVAGLRREMSRFVTRRDAGESRELWLALSDAIRQLASEGKVRRLDRDWETPNGNSALWIMSGVSEESVLDTGEFRARAEEIPVYFPSREGGRVLAPVDARQLVLSLLQAADARIAFELLVSEAKRHAVLDFQYAEPLDYGEEGEEPRTHAVEFRYHQALWMREEALQRAEAIWRQSEQEEDGSRVLCLYFLPKHFLGEKITLQALGGDFRRTGETSKRIQRVFADHLALNRLTGEIREEGPDEGFSDVIQELTGTVTELLLEKCSENVDGKNFHEDINERKGG